MKHLATLLIVVGFCTAAVGAAGFEARDASVADDGSEIEARGSEPEAWPILLGGLAVFLVGVVVRRGTRSVGTAGGAHAGGHGEFLQLLRSVRSLLVELDESRDALDVDAVRERTEALTRGAFFDLTTRHEELIALIGFTNYAKVWDNVANAERRLARFWSMATDGHGTEGMAEIPIARACIERAYEDLAAL